MYDIPGVTYPNGAGKYADILVDLKDMRMDSSISYFDHAAAPAKMVKNAMNHMTNFLIPLP